MFSRIFLVKRFYRTNSTTLQWNKTIRTHQINGNHQQALKLFQLGIEKNTFEPNSMTFLTMLDICKELKSLSTVRTLHQLIDQSKKIHPNDEDIRDNPRIRSSLMDVYIKCNDLNSAYQVFQSMKQRNVIDFGAMMAAFNHHEQYDKTLELAKQMSQTTMFSSSIILTLILHACAELKRFDDGCEIHRRGKDLLRKDKIFFNELLNFYLKFDDEEKALKLFEEISHHQHSIVDFSLLMKFYNRQYRPEKTIEFYQRLKQNSRLSMDSIIYVLILQAVANGCCSQLAEQIVEESKKSFNTNLDVNNALINLYGKLGEFERAIQLFHSMSKRNIVSFNVLLNLYGLYRQSDKALECYNQMCQQGHQPDEKTFVLLLYVLSQTPTKINEAKRIYSLVEAKRRGPMLTAAMIIALTRANLIDEVQQLFKDFSRDHFLLFAMKSINNSTNDENHFIFDLLFSQIYQHGGLNDRFITIKENFDENYRLRSLFSKSIFEKSPGVIQYVQSDENQRSECKALDVAMKIHEKTSSKSIVIGTNHRVSRESYEYFQRNSEKFPKKKFVLRDSKNVFLFSNGSSSTEMSS